MRNLVLVLMLLEASACRYQNTFHQDALVIVSHDELYDVTDEEIAEYFLTDWPIALPLFERQSQKSTSQN